VTRKIPFLPIALAFALFGALEIGFVFLVASDPFTRALFTTLLVLAQLIGAFAFHRFVNRPPRPKPGRKV